MLPDPLHPAVVHFPIVLAMLLPISAVVALWAIRGGARPSRAWAIPLVFAAALAGSAWLSVETGEDQEERVEEVLAEGALHDHEEAAERFLVLSGILLLVTAGGILRGRAGKAARYIATAGTVAIVLAAVQTGAEGGELVYRHGAARAYATPTPAAEGAAVPAAGQERRALRSEEDDD